MKAPDALPAERPDSVRKYKRVMRVLGVIYLAVGLLFLFLPDLITYAMNVVPRTVGWGELLPDSSERFWLVLAVSMMGMLTAISFLAAETPGTKGYALVHILSKVLSTVGFLYMYFNHRRYFAYLVGATTDFPIAIIVTYYTLRTAGKTSGVAAAQPAPEVFQ